MHQTQEAETNPPVEAAEPLPSIDLEQIQLTPTERSYQQLKERLLEGMITLDIQPNRAMKWLIERTISNSPAFKVLLMFNYIEWIILLPGLVALYFYGWLIGLAGLAICFLISVLVINRVKKGVLRGGVREFVIQDLVSLEELYTIGAVRFRKGKKGKWIRHPRNWQEVL